MDRDEHLDWRCRMGRHHYEIIADPNPEVRGGSLRKCTRCEHESENEIKLNPLTHPNSAWKGFGGG